MTLPFDGAISNFFESEAPDPIRKAIEKADKDDILSPAIPMTRRWSKDDYEDQMEALQLRAGAASGAMCKETGKRLVVVFEGRDASGKGGTISRFRENLNPRVARVVALSKPSDLEAGRVVFPALRRRTAHRGRDRAVRPVVVQPRRGRACLRLLHARSSANISSARCPISSRCWSTRASS